MELEKKKQYLIILAALEAKGEIAKLKELLTEALHNGLTISEAKEALSHLYAYTGFPRSLNGLGALQEVIKVGTERGESFKEGKEADALPTSYNALEAGIKVQTQLGGGKPFNYSFAPQTDYYLKAHLFGDIFSRNNLSFANRELVTIGAISALPGCDAQLFAHVSGSRNMGVKDDELRALPALLREKVGEAEANRVELALGKLFDAPVSAIETVAFNIWPKGEPNVAYAQYFVGQSYLADLGSKDGGPHNVTFEPRCRNNWHIHHNSVQVLVCVAGRGWYQEWGKEAIELRPGKVIPIPEGVKHWHGAAHNSWFQHLAYMTNVKDGASNEWLEPVSDEIYNKLP